MSKFSPYQIADLLSLSKKQLTYALYIEKYPKIKNRKNYDVSNQIDRFYKNVHNAFFNESLLIIGSLLKPHKQTINFWNWTDYLQSREKELRKINKKFLLSGLKIIRDQIVAHSNSDNQINKFTLIRRQGIINYNLVNKLSEIIESLIKEFDDFTRSINKDTHAPSFFSAWDVEKEVEAIMDSAPPQLTNHDVI